MWATTPLATPVMGSNPPKPLIESDGRPPLPLNCPRVAGNLRAGEGESLTVCWGLTGELAEVRFGVVASLGAMVVGSRILVDVGEVLVLRVLVPLVDVE